MDGCSISAYIFCALNVFAHYCNWTVNNEGKKTYTTTLESFFHSVCVITQYVDCRFCKFSTTLLDGLKERERRQESEWDGRRGSKKIRAYAEKATIQCCTQWKKYEVNIQYTCNANAKQNSKMSIHVYILSQTHTNACTQPNRKLAQWKKSLVFTWHRFLIGSTPVRPYNTFPSYIFFDT